MQEAELRRAAATKFSSQLRNLLTAFFRTFLHSFFLFPLFQNLKIDLTAKIGHKTLNSPSITAAANLDEESVKKTLDRIQYLLQLLVGSAGGCSLRSVIVLNLL